MFFSALQVIFWFEKQENVSALSLKGCQKKQEIVGDTQGCSGLARSGFGRRTNHTM